MSLQVEVPPSGVAPDYKTGASISILNGPGKYELEKALFDPHGVNARRVSLRIEHETFLATVSSVEIGDGSGEAFLLKGLVWEDSSSRPYEAFIRTTTRMGGFKFTAD